MNTLAETGSTRTTCPYCGVGCGVLASPRADGTVAIAGDTAHPANFGRLCSKGSALGETLIPERRLLHPSMDGARASWDAALDFVAARFSETIRDHGPDSVALYVSGQILTEDYYVANKLMKGFVGSANIDTNSRLCMASSVAGHKRAFGSDTVPGTYEDLEEADLLVLVGSNLAWCHPVLFQRVQAARAKRPGMRLVVIDPRETASAREADLHLPVRADGDTALFLGALAAIEAAGAIDRAYVEAHTEGLDAALDAARPFADLARLAETTGLDAERLTRFLDLYARTDKTVTVYSQGVNQSAGGTDKVSAILNCHLATGRIGRPGAGPFSVTGQPNAMGGREVGGLANQLAAHMDFGNPAHTDVVRRFWQAPNVADKPGLKAVDLFRAVADGRVRALWIMGTNPVDSLPEADGVAEALRRCPFVVVSDVVTDTDTMPFAHVALPSAAWGEKDGTVTNSERRISRQRGFLAASGEARPDWWQIAEVGKRMGFGAAFDYPNAAAIFREHAALSAFENGGTRDFDIGALKALDDAAYEALAPVRWPVPVDAEPTVRFFADGRFFTPNGRAKLLAVAPAATPALTPARPFVLNTGRIRDQWHTMTRTGRSARLSAHLAEPFCELHPADAARLGVREADLVSLSTEHGTATLRALLTDRVAPGTLFAPCTGPASSRAPPASTRWSRPAPIRSPVSPPPRPRRPRSRGSRRNGTASLSRAPSPKRRASSTGPRPARPAAGGWNSPATAPYPSPTPFSASPRRRPPRLHRPRRPAAPRRLRRRRQAPRRALAVARARRRLARLRRLAARRAGLRARGPRPRPCRTPRRRPAGPRRPRLLLFRRRGRRHQEGCGQRLRERRRRRPELAGRHELWLLQNRDPGIDRCGTTCPPARLTPPPPASARSAWANSRPCPSSST